MIQKITKEKLEEKGKITDTTAEGTVQLWLMPDGTEYVVLCDNSIITREEDNTGEPFFPTRRAK